MGMVWTMAREYFCCYHSYLEAMEQLNDAERGRLFTACLIYSKTGEAQKLCGNERFIFPVFRSQMDRDNANYEERCRTQSANARKRWDAMASGGMPNNANDANTKEKAKTKAKTKAKGNISPLPPLDGFSPELQSAFSDWLDYKAERHEAYKPTGLRNLQSEVRNNAEKYGDQAVAAVIRTSMSCGYRGIVFDRLQERRQQTTQRVRTDADYADGPEF